VDFTILFATKGPPSYDLIVAVPGVPSVPGKNDHPLALYTKYAYIRGFLHLNIYLPIIYTFTWNTWNKKIRKPAIPRFSAVPRSPVLLGTILVQTWHTATW
jgi:hypothetical protein